MKSLATAVLAFLGTAYFLSAEDLEVGGKIYKDYKVVDQTKTGITIVHSTGIATISAQELSKALREEYGLDLDEAKAAEERKTTEIVIKKKEIAQKKYLESSVLYATGWIFQVVSDGILLEDGFYSTGEKEEVERSKTVLVDGPTKLNPHRKRQYENRKLPSDYVLKTEAFGRNIFVYCDTEELVDGVDWTAAIWPCGTYSYLNVQGAQKTVARYTTDIQQALDYAYRKDLIAE